MFNFLHNSPFEDRLNTNYVPSDSEVDQIHAFLVEPKNELACVDAQIDEMNILIHQLKVKRDALNAEIQPYMALISPIRRIPQDVLQEIFLACLPQAHNALIDPGAAPMLLGRICGHWRSVAYSTPRLWSSLHIPALSSTWLSTMPLKIKLKLAMIVAKWLDRAAGCPLSISLSRAMGHHIDPLGADAKFTGVSRRIHHLSIVGQVNDVRPLLLIHPEDLPRLESIDLRCYSASDEPSTFWAGAPILRAPNLSRVALDVLTDVLTLPLQWSQMTHLHLSCFPVRNSNTDSGGLDQNGAQELLHRCPNLVRCLLRFTNPVRFIAGPPIPLHHLDALVILNELSSVEFMQTLFLPKLNYLGVGQEISNPAMRTFERATPPLTLELLDTLSQEDLLALLNLFPRISCLRAPGIYLDEEFLDALRPAPTTLSPSLKHMELGICSFSDTALINFIRGRMPAHPIKRITAAQFQRAMQVDVVRELESFISQGLQVELQYTEDTPWKFEPRNGIYCGPEL
ncbi:hypothetical protein DFH09DRAFT_978943 [Mycena vulgaris]|nr:hypothetical protein DFH09DRAFT_978943 [Mycena vulgaris]